MITFKNISKAYENQLLVDNLTLTIDAGEFVTIIGSSGSGKTTLLKMINGLIKPNQGHVLIDGQPLNRDHLIPLRRQIGYAVQGSVLFPHLNVEKNITYVPRLLKNHSKKQLKILAQTKLKQVGLDEALLTRYPHELSGGQQQRVGIARALAASPHILLMDEPFGAVDEITRHQLQQEIASIHQKLNLTIVFVTHDISEALKLGTKVLVMDKGKVHQYASPEEIINHPKTPFVKKLLALK